MESIALLTGADKELNLKIDSEIQKLLAIIEGLKNADSVLTNNQKDSALRFHVETSGGYAWPQNTFFTYKVKLTDTHNAMNAGTGIFTAPFSGTYGFVFYGRFQCNSSGFHLLYVDHNGARSTIYGCFSDSNFHDYLGNSVYFARSLKQGDRVGIFAGTAVVELAPHAAKFTGFLLQKS
jgi:hypothetical protein